MPAVTLGIAVVAVGGGAYYLRKRSKLKDGDKDIEKERNRERKLELQRGGSFPTVLNHCLHQHQLFLDYDGTGTYRCDLCLKAIEGNRYHCRENCNFNLHKACALSNHILANLIEKTSLQTFAHKHPLTKVTGTSSSTCKHCKNKCQHTYRYFCSSCDKKFHLFCAVHPTRLSSFLHPEHELELRTRPHLQKCAVCHHRGESNARVYGCKQCEFYVHPGCAVKVQYGDYPVHAEHLLVFREVKTAVLCGACGVKCKYWSYSCSCCDVNFHEECREKCSSVNRSEDGSFVKDMAGIFGREFKRGFKKGVKDQIKDDIKEQYKDESPEEIVGDAIDTIFSLFT